MAREDMMVKYGTWAFLIGILIALIVGLYQAYDSTFLIAEPGSYVAWLLAVIGVIVGLLAFFGRGTITEKEVPAFLMAGIALVVMYGVFQSITLKPYLGAILSGVSMSLAILVAPAVGILAIKAIWDIGREV